jgi:hypothetical protein
MYSAPSPFDDKPTKPIDVQTLQEWWVRQRHERHSTTSDATYQPRAPRTSSAFCGPGAAATVAAIEAGH